MDGVEVARQSAAHLHAQAVARGLDPWRPYEFVVAEAERRGLDVEPTARGAAVLAGGRAVLVPDDRLILHENVGTPFEQAYLVAHEIGHAELGDDPNNEPALKIDAERAAEPSPVGIDRVVDYGRRQRREAQMDLFAREFLLPRPVIRKLHLEAGLTGSAIADRLGAPFEVVGQQMLDALLLPPVTPIPEEEVAERPLNPLQAAAAGHRGRAYLLEAGPGTGKTQTLTARVEGLLADNVDPRRILLLTFSNKAAREMAERTALKRKDAAAAMWIGTFHAFGLDLIRRFHTELGLPKAPRLMDRTEAVELLEQEFPRLGLVHYRNLYDPTQVIADMLVAISRAKDEVVNEGEYAQLAESMRQRAGSADDRKAAERALEVARAYDAYETLKRRAHCVDFGDLVSMPVRLLEGDPAVRVHLQNQYDHVLVDEYQDVNRSSIRLLAALSGDGENLWAVGDAKQSIYRFRGASSFNMIRFGKEDFAGGMRGRLKLNYRSVGEIVHAFSAFFVRMKSAGGDSSLVADRGFSGRHPELRTVDHGAQQTVALADAVEEMRRAGHRYRDQAVLCTGNEKLSILGQDLERMGVPVLFLGSLFERPEVKDLLALLSVLTDGRAMGLVRVACRPEFQMPIMDVAAILDHLRSHHEVPGEWFRTPNLIAGLSGQGQAALSGLSAALNCFDQCARPWTVLAKVLLDRTWIAAEISRSTNVADRTRGIAIWQLMNFIRVQPRGRGLPIVRLLDRIRRLVRLGDDRDLRQLPAAAQSIDAVHLMTIHGAKGLEFPVLHVPGINADTLPRTSSVPPCLPPDGMVEGGEGSSLEIFRAGDTEEQECLFYVALSRARDRLFIYAPRRKSNGHNRPLSCFLDRLGSGLVRRAVSPARTLPPAPDAAEVDLVIDWAMRFSGPQIALYESCPRRFFYTHVLQIGGRRTATAFMRMHEAVRMVIQAAIVGDEPVTGEPDLERRVVHALTSQGLAEHGYADEYRALALTMVRYFFSIRVGHTLLVPTDLCLTFGDEQIVIRPDDVLVRADGGHTLRRVRTGHHRLAESEDVGAAAFILAARQAFPSAIVELVHLSDQAVRPLTLSTRKLETRRGKLADFLAEVRFGRFPAHPSPRTCPGCPAFFVCGPTPSGTLTKKY